MSLFIPTSTFAALHVSLKLPALVTWTLDAGFLLLALLATLEVFGTKALDLAGLVVSSQLHAQGTRAHEALSRNDAAVVTTTTVVHWTQVCMQETEMKGWGYIWDREAVCVFVVSWISIWKLQKKRTCWKVSHCAYFSERYLNIKKVLPQSFSSEPSGQSSMPSHSFSAGRQMDSLVAHMWWDDLHASQLSSSELSSQSLSPSHTQALLMQRADMTEKA